MSNKNKKPSSWNSGWDDMGEVEQWSDPVPLTSLLPRTPELSVEMIPMPLRAWLVEIADRACIPLDFPAIPAIVAIGALIGRKVGIKPSRNDDWLVVPNLWGGVVARPGMMKSYAVSEAIKPIEGLQRKATEEYKRTLAEAEAYAVQARAERKAVEKEIEKVALGRTSNEISTDDDKNSEEGNTAISSKLIELRQKLTDMINEAEMQKVNERRYMTNDATVEKLGEVMLENTRGILIVRDELVGWLKGMDKQGHEGDRSFHLEAWNGTGSYTYDRIGRGTIHIPAICESVIGGIQPGKLKAYVQSAINADGSGDDGLLQRIQLLVWSDKLPEWRQPASFPDKTVKEFANKIFERLDKLDAGLIATVDENGGIPYLRFSANAQVIFDEWREVLEKRLRSEEMVKTPAFESHLAKYRSLMPSLALLFHLVEGVGDAADSYVESEVSQRATELAKEWCSFLETHAKKVYADEVYSQHSIAHLLAAKITEGRIRNGTTLSNIFERDWSGLTDPEKVRNGLKVLSELNWLRAVEKATGGRPTEMIYLNPEIERKSAST